MGKYILDYFSKYYFFEENDFINEIDNGKHILEELKKCNRFDYKGFSYKFTRFNNISMGETKTNVEIEFIDNDINILLDGEIKHLDLIYKFETKHLEDHVRVSTKLSEKHEDISCLLYISHNQSKEFIYDLSKVKDLQLSKMIK